MPVIKTGDLRTVECRRARGEELVRKLEKLATSDQAASLDEARLKRELKMRFADMHTLLERQVSSARRLLRTLMAHPLRCEAVQEGDRKEYRVTGTGRYLPLSSFPHSMPNKTTAPL